MSGVLETGAIAKLDLIVPSQNVASLTEIDTRNVAAIGFEQRLVERLSTYGSRSHHLFESYHRQPPADDRKKSSVSHRLPGAWCVLSELKAHQSSDNVEQHLAGLLNCLDIIGRPISPNRAAVRSYVQWMQLYAMLPIYLRQENSDLETALNESIFLAYLAISLIDLDQALESELFELLTELPFIHLPPCTALERSLGINVSRIVDAFDSRSGVSSRGPSTVIRNRPTFEQCEGYWSIVKQWTDGAAHLRIPPKLSIGKILWPKVQDHWSRLSQALHEVDSAPDASPTTTEFVEIRSSNDPQLAETLDIQLQRCREVQGSMALVVIQVLKHLETEQTPRLTHRLPRWQESVIEQLRAATDGRTTRGFISEASELTLIIDDLDRNEVTGIIREILEIASCPSHLVSSMVEIPRIPLVCGVACVSSPSKRFQIDQLIVSAWRCLDAAKRQGAGTVKSLEVY